MDVGSIPVYVVRCGTLWYAVVRRGTQFTGTGFPRVHGQALLELWKSPWSLWGSRGYAPMGVDGGVCRLLQSIELPATTVGECRRRHSLRRQGRTLDCPFNFPPPRVAGWFLICRCQVCNRTAVAMVATGPRQVAL